MSRWIKHSDFTWAWKVTVTHELKTFQNTPSPQCDRKLRAYLFWWLVLLVLYHSLLCWYIAKYRWIRGISKWYKTCSISKNPPIFCNFLQLLLCYWLQFSRCNVLQSNHVDGPWPKKVSRIFIRHYQYSFLVCNWQRNDILVTWVLLLLFFSNGEIWNLW